MKRPIFLILVLLQLFSQAMGSTLKEGLNELTGTLPKAVKHNAHSVFAIYSEDDRRIRTGTSVLIKVITKELITELYFITNEHVIRNACTGIGECNQINLFQDMVLEKTQRNGIKLISYKGFFRPKYELLKVSQNPDLALLKATIHNDDGDTIDRPISLPQKCGITYGEKLYSIGFFDPTVRTVKSHLPIQFQDQQHKRWSEGLAIKNYSINKASERHTLLGTTLDALPGGSGGPVLNEAGELVGIISNTAAVLGNGYKYEGNETPGRLDWHALAVPCELLTKFIKDI